VGIKIKLYGIKPESESRKKEDAWVSHGGKKAWRKKKGILLDAPFNPWPI
jgi:hypothetical protein